MTATVSATVGTAVPDPPLPAAVRPLVLACGALARELRAVLGAAGLAAHVDVEFLPAPLHNRPERIVPAVDARLAEVDPARPVFLGYADCGTGGALDRFVADADRPIARLPGDHCYEFFAGGEQFAQLHADELGTFFLTDFLARHFDALVWQGLGIDRRPELRDLYFGNYRRVMLLSQSDDPAVVASARDAADRLALDFVHVPTGLDAFAAPIRVALGTGVS